MAGFWITYCNIINYQGKNTKLIFIIIGKYHPLDDYDVWTKLLIYRFKRPLNIISTVIL